MLSKTTVEMLFSLAVMLAFAGTGKAASKPTTVAEIALYQGTDRERMLIEGAKKEGQILFYNSNTWLDTVAREFEKKYPFVKVSIWRADSTDVLKRAVEEYAAGRFLADVIEVTEPNMVALHKKDIYQEYYSPEITGYRDDLKEKGKSGVFYLADRELYIGLGFNTGLIPSAQAPKSYKELLDPRWKGKISLVGSSTGVRWLGNVLDVMGHEFLEKLARQEIKVHNISGAALVNQIISGEVPLSPTIFYSNIFTAKRSGAPVDWRPLEPVIAQVGYSGITTKAPHPHAALLFLDYFHSKEGQKVVTEGGIGSPREEVGSLKQKFKKTYLQTRYSFADYEKQYDEWEGLMKHLFIRKR
jgi:iron(III) transport system substrate-binding protein